MNKLQARLRDTKAFTLIELLIVIAILAVLTGVGVFVYGAFDGDGVQEDIDDANLRTCQLAQEIVIINGGTPLTDVNDYVEGIDCVDILGLS